jgi:hypothetical protein
MLAIVIVATGVVASLELLGVVSTSNSEARRITVASQLVRHIEELMGGLPFDDPITRDTTFGPEVGETLATFNDLDDFDDFDTYAIGAPVDALRLTIPELDQYAQQVTVTPVDAASLLPGGTGAVRIKVTVVWRRNASDTPRAVLSTSWYRIE